ncbi:MAG: MFS transporter, partial [Hyphomicrobiales bacterium]|nr:MFS transporter [Hyphomicrobiales bacterium]
TGLATIALALLAFELAGGRAGVVLGTALAIKMLANVFITPVATALVAGFSRRRVLIAMDLVRASIVLLLPFVTEVWQIYVLIFALQASSAVFTPTFQAVIPDILTDEDAYTRALSLSRIAYDLESLLSPTLAALLLTVIGFHWLFDLTALGFLVSAALVLSVTIPQPEAAAERGGLWQRTTRGLDIYLRTPRLRGLGALNLAVAAAGAMVIVNTVVVVRAVLGRPESDVAIAMAVFGAGSIVSAVLLPRLLERMSDRTVMVAGAWLLTAGLAALALLAASGGPALLWPALLAVWWLLGVGYGAVLTPSGRLVRRSAHAADRPAVFAAQFALSHACWLLTYPLAGLLATYASLSVTLLALAGLTVLGGGAALALWPGRDPEVLEHTHDDLPRDHPHIA